MKLVRDEFDLERPGRLTSGDSDAAVCGDVDAMATVC